MGKVLKLGSNTTDGQNDTFIHEPKISLYLQHEYKNISQRVLTQTKVQSDSSDFHVPCSQIKFKIYSNKIKETGTDICL